MKKVKEKSESGSESESFFRLWRNEDGRDEFLKDDPRDATLLQEDKSKSYFLCLLSQFIVINMIHLLSQRI